MMPASGRVRETRWSRGLLVSVRNATEALAALSGAMIVDVKEPARGPLGRADAAVTAEVIEAVAGRVAVTLAGGELADGFSGIHQHLLHVLDRMPHEAALPVAVKAGPAGLGIGAWLKAFREFSEGLPEAIEPVAVAYADWQAASAPSPHDVLTAAAAAGARTVLIDTFDKSGPGLFGAIGQTELAGWVSQARNRGLGVAIAGKLTEAEVSLAIDLDGDVVGVRSAACSGGRLGCIDASRVRALGMLIRVGHETRACVPEGDSIS